MRKIWRYKLFQWIVFILIVLSLGTATRRLDTLQFLFENGNLAIENEVVQHLIKDIKIVKIVVITLWGLVFGLYTNFIYSINKEIPKETTT
ncbi:hypothetical protein H8S20_16385 [Clostridium sp. NSJ-6]|uniref:DUF1049 domain-containing protein n=1 Tax=Clostridium hominis TaxID=2763036 RepID=A0ABR7DHW9_9CLOT|nr:hypothetical protein [Clostridium hominis]MBC5630438.1 hypothetical protein [Clostridium hominis]MDU2670845.1 hypothetical protein [Clostridium sp.]